MNACVRSGVQPPTYTHPLQDASGHGATLSSAVGTAMPGEHGTGGTCRGNMALADRWGTMRGDKYYEMLCGE